MWMWMNIFMDGRRHRSQRSIWVTVGCRDWVFPSDPDPDPDPVPVPVPIPIPDP